MNQIDPFSKTLEEINLFYFIFGLIISKFEFHLKDQIQKKKMTKRTKITIFKRERRNIVIKKIRD